MWYDTCVTDSDENETASRLRRFGARAWRTALCRCMRTRTAPLLCGDRRMEGSDGPRPGGGESRGSFAVGRGRGICMPERRRGRQVREELFLASNCHDLCLLGADGLQPPLPKRPGLAQASPSAGLSPRGVRAPKNVDERENGDCKGKVFFAFVPAGRPCRAAPPGCVPMKGQGISVSSCRRAGPAADGICRTDGVVRHAGEKTQRLDLHRRQNQQPFLF